MNQYLVYLPHSHKFLDANEKDWTPHFFNAAIFTSAELAQDIAEREGKPDATILQVVGGAA